MKALITGGMEVMGAETSRNIVQERIRPVIDARHRDVSLIYDILILDKVDIEPPFRKSTNTPTCCTSTRYWFIRAG